MADYTNPSGEALAITPSDSTYFSSPTRGIYVGGAGNITCITASGASVVFYNCVAGSILPIRVVLINATGTSASNLVGLY